MCADEVFYFVLVGISDKGVVVVEGEFVHVVPDGFVDPELPGEGLCCFHAGDDASVGCCFDHGCCVSEEHDVAVVVACSCW